METSCVGKPARESYDIGLLGHLGPFRMSTSEGFPHASHILMQQKPVFRGHCKALSASSCTLLESSLDGISGAPYPTNKGAHEARPAASIPRRLL